MTKVERQILKNQEVILLALDKLLTPMNEDENGETVTSFTLMDNYHKTIKMLDEEE